MQLIFNKVSGGGEKVKINGLPPNERLNLKEVTNSVVFGDYQINETNLKTIFEEDGILYFSGNKAIYRFDRKNFTKIGDTPGFSKYVYAAIKKDNSFIFMTEDYNQYKIYKFENGEFTELGTTPYGEQVSTYCHFFLNETVYFRTHNEPYKVYKSDNFGKAWTDITRSITLRDGLKLSNLEFWEGKEQFNQGNCKYAFYQNWAKPPKRIKFDGKTLNKIDLKIEDATGFIFNSIDNRNGRNKILAVERKSINNNKEKISLYKVKIINEAIELELIKSNTFKTGLFSGTICLDEKNESIASLAINRNNCVFTEFLKRTYIPE